MLLLLAQLVVAQPGNPYLDRARDLAKDLRFIEAIEQLEVALKVPGLDAQQRREVVELLARCQVAEGQRAAAETTFTALLLDAPDWRLDRERTSPKILEAFDAAKRRLYPSDYLVFEAVPAPAGRLRFKVVDPWARVSTVRLHEGRRGQFTSANEACEAGSASFALVVAAGERVTWYAEALAADGAVLAHVGSFEAPQLIEALDARVAHGSPPPEPSGIARRPLGWVAVGLAVAAASVGAALIIDSQRSALAASNGSAPPGDWADTALATHARAVDEARASRGLFIGAGVVGAAGAVLLAW